MQLTRSALSTGTVAFAVIPSVWADLSDTAERGAMRPNASGERARRSIKSFGTKTLMLNARLAAVLALSMVIGLFSQSQAKEAEHRRVVVVSVIDKDGNPVPGLTAANFRAKANEQDVTVLSASADGTTPRRIAIVVDASSSMTEAWASVWAAAVDMVQRLTPKNRIAILTWDYKLRQQSDLSSDPGVLEQALLKGKAHKPDGPGALYNGLVTASAGLSGEDLDVICLLTDGDDNASLATASDAQAAAARHGVRVFVLLFQKHRSGALAFSSAEDTMRTITEGTGGVLFSAGFRAEAVLRDLNRLMTGGYHLEVASPQAFDKPRDWTLEVLDPEGKKRKDVRLAYPRQLVPVPD